MFLGNGKSPVPSQKKAGAYQAKSETRALVLIRNLRGLRVKEKGEVRRQNAEVQTNRDCTRALIAAPARHHTRILEPARSEAILTTILTIDL